MKKHNVILRSGHPHHNNVPLEEIYRPYYQLYNRPVYFRENIPYAFIDHYRYTLSAPAQSVDDVLMVALSDIKMIFCRQFSFSDQNETIIMSRGTCSAKITPNQKISIEDAEGIHLLEEIPLLIDNHLYIPIEGLMVNGFGKKSQWQRTYIAEGDYLGISDNDDLFPSIQFVKDLAVYSDKHFGIVRGIYYYEQANDLVPYRAYIPTSNSEKTPSKLMIWLHGADPDSTVDFDPDRTHCLLEKLSEAYNMISLSVTGYSFGFYGAGNPDMNRDALSEKEISYLDLCENEPLQALETICRLYYVDREHIFIAGNSMGGAGTVWETLRHPDIFKALAPCGAFTTHDIASMDWSPIKGKSLLFMCGTENIGFDNVPKIVKTFNECGVKASSTIVPGGIHDDAWVSALPDIFEFFSKI